MGLECQQTATLANRQCIPSFSRLKCLAQSSVTTAVVKEVRSCCRTCPGLRDNRNTLTSFAPQLHDCKVVDCNRPESWATMECFCAYTLSASSNILAAQHPYSRARCACPQHYLCFSGSRSASTIKRDTPYFLVSTIT